MNGGVEGGAACCAVHPSNTLAQKNATTKTIAVPHGPLISHTIGPPKVTSKDSKRKQCSSHIGACGAAVALVITDARWQRP